MEATERKRLTAIVSGRVQGVGFRYFAQRLARTIGITGQVRNLGSGQVEIIAEGEIQLLKRFLQEIEAGPSFGHVSSVSVTWSAALDQYTTFTIAY
ncbi:MAG: acylphosphatase [bacterium]|jgi:acylphosphatase|nr:acylphosphatase [bacterium]